MQGKRQNVVDRYVQLLILAYFRELKTEYNLTDLREKTGIPFHILDDYIEEMMKAAMLQYEDNMICISETGRLELLHSEMKDYSFSSELEEAFPAKKWEMDKIYYIRKFSGKKWRGNKK